MVLAEKITNVWSGGRNLAPDKFRNKNLVFFFLMMSLTVDKLNVTAAITSFYSISELLDASPSTASWVLSGYALTLGSFIIVFGKAADIVGVHTVFVLGTATMALFSLLAAAVDSSVIAVIVFRAFQGIAGAALVPSGYSLTANYYQGKARLIAVKIFTAVLTFSYGLGTVLGGAFSTTKIGYKGLFYFTFALSLISAVVLYFIIIPVRKPESQNHLSLKNLDFIGVFFLTSGLLLIIFGFTEASDGWNSPKVYVTIPIGSVLVLIMFIFELVFLKKFHKKAISAEQLENQEERSYFAKVIPIFPREIVKVPNFAAMFTGVFFINGTFIAVQVSLIEYYEYVEKNSPILAAVKTLPLSIGLLIGVFLFKPIIVEKFGLKVILMISSLLLLGGCIWLSRLNYSIAHSYWKFEFVSQFVIGYGFNLFFVLFVTGLMAQTPLHMQGVVSGVSQTISQIGGSIATAIVSSIIGNSTFNTSDSEAKHQALLKFRNALYLSVGLTGALNIIMMFIKLSVKKPNNDSSTEAASKEQEDEEAK